MTSANEIHHKPLAIVGMACRFPGADNLDEFWTLVRDGKSGITTVPAERLPPELYYDPQPGVLGKTYCLLGGVVRHRPVNPAICPIDSRLAERYDPAHVTLCEVVAAAFRHAGYDPRKLPTTNTGVYVGNSSGGTDLDSRLAYHSYAREMADLLRQVDTFEQLAPGVREKVIEQIVASIRAAYPDRRTCPIDRHAPNAAAALIVEAFRLNGPSLVVDSACASSLMALELAAPALRDGRIEMAVVAGAAYRKLYEWVAIAQAKSMSARGCCPFDAEADGLISSDGYGAVILKTLERALADGDHICGVVRGIGLSSDGRGKGFWAPRKEGQIEAIRRAYADGIDPARVQYVEAHATSTQLGDATELAALSEAFAGVFEYKVPATSVKANVGHTLEAAGIAGLIKTLLAMQHGVIPPAANFQTPSPDVDWDAIPFYVPQTAIEWPQWEDAHPRRAGIDSFGIGGLNLHVVIDDAPYEHERNRAKAAKAGSQVARSEPIDEPIAIIGMGALFPDANSFEGFCDLLFSGRDPKQPVPAERWDATFFESETLADLTRADARPLGGFLVDWQFDWRKYKVPPKQFAAANPLQFMILDVAGQALEHAGYIEKPFDRSRVATIVGANFQNDFIVDSWHGVWLTDFRHRLEQLLATAKLSEDEVAGISQAYAELLLSRKPAAHDDTGSASSSTLASRISKQFDLMGGATTIDAGDGSSLAAIDAAVDLLRSRKCDMVICAAGQQNMNRLVYEQLAKVGLLGESELRSPFDADANGVVPAEGAGAFLLKRLDDARRDGDVVHAVIRRIASATDSSSIERALSDSMGRANHVVTPEQVALVETNVVDREHRFTLETALVDNHDPTRRHTPLCVGSTISQLGTLAAAGGMASALKCIASLQQSRVPATFGLTNPAPSMAIRRKALDPLRVPKDLTATISGKKCIAAVSTFSNQGFISHGGTAYHLLLESGVEAAGDSTRSAKAEARGRESETANGQRSASASRNDVTKPTVLPPASERLMARFILRTVDSPLPEQTLTVPTFQGSVIILGENASAAALRDRLVELGATVYEVPVGDDALQTVAMIDAIWEQGIAPHLFVMTARDDDGIIDWADAASWHRRRYAGVTVPFLVCQRWFDHVERNGLLSQASLVGATMLGGDFGFSGHCRAAEGGGIAGMLKSACNESRGVLRVKVIDAPHNEPAKMIAREIVDELAAATDEVEVGYARGRRQSVRAIPEPAASLPHREIPRGSVWVVTGGARGVTAVVARELGRQFDLKLHLLGSTPLAEIDAAWRELDADGLKELQAQVMREAVASGDSPQSAWRRVEKSIEIDRMLVRCQQEGISATYHACDVADRDALDGVLQQVRRVDGPITGIIHGAGDQVAARFAKKKPENVERVLGAKLDGTVALMELTAQDPLRFFVAFGSTSGRFGGYVQTDYSLANEMLAKLVNDFRARRPECAAFTVHWTAWDEVGMATSDAANVILPAIGVKYMPPLEGVAHLIDELQAESRETEILIADHPEGVHSDHVSMPTPAQWEQHASFRDGIIRSPLIEHVYPFDARSAVAEATFDPTSDPFLLSHLDEGIPLFPAVMGIEMCAEAAEIVTGGLRTVEVLDFQLLNGLRMAEPLAYRAMVTIDVEGDLATCRLSGDFYDKQGRFTEARRPYQTCTLRLSETIRQLDIPEIGSPPDAWDEIVYPDDWRTRRDNASGTVFYGPALRALKAVHYQGYAAWGRLIAPALADLAGRRAGTHWSTAPALLDGVLLGCDLFASHLLETRQFPHAIERLQLGRMPRDGEQCISHTVYRGRDERHLLFEFWLFGDDDSVLAHCSGCRFVDLGYSLKDTVYARSNP